MSKIGNSIEKAREFQKNTYFCFIDGVDHKKTVKNSKRERSKRPPYLSPKTPVCGSRSNS